MVDFTMVSALERVKSDAVGKAHKNSLFYLTVPTGGDTNARGRG